MLKLTHATLLVLASMTAFVVASPAVGELCCPIETRKAPTQTNGTLTCLIDQPKGDPLSCEYVMENGKIKVANPPCPEEALLAFQCPVENPSPGPASPSAPAASSAASSK